MRTRWPRRRCRLLVVPVAAVAVVAGCAAQAGSRPTADPATTGGRTDLSARAAQVDVGQSVWVKVSAATLWVSPSSPRPVDAPALSHPVHIGSWLRDMSTAERRGLVGRVETQSLLGERLLVTGVQPHWLHVVAVTQPTHRDSRGYPGYVPRRQVTTKAPVDRHRVATVVKPTAHLRGSGPSTTMQVSFGTVLPVLRHGTRWTKVVLPTGEHSRIRNASVVRHHRRDAALPLTAASVLKSARRFIGIPYLWGGRSGFAVDCSGFTNLVYGVHGVRLPRDADDQATRGTAVGIGRQQRSDLLFFDHGSGIAHVGFYAGNGRLLHAPQTGSYVGTVDLGSMSGLVAVRRFT